LVLAALKLYMVKLRVFHLLALLRQRVEDTGEPEMLGIMAHQAVAVAAAAARAELLVELVIPPALLQRKDLQVVAAPTVREGRAAGPLALV
jgi:hypothetical protein